MLSRTNAFNVWAIWLAVVAGWLVVYGGPLGVAVAAATILGVFGGGWVLRHPSVLVVEIPVALMLLSTLVLRIRDASALSDNPLDPAGIYRVAAVGLAGLIAMVSLAMGNVRPPRLPSKFFALYVLASFLAVPISLMPALTLYRPVELAIGGLVLLAIWSRVGEEGLERTKKLLFRFIVGACALTWVAAAVAPAYGLIPVSPSEQGALFPVRLQLAFPAINANTLGFFGALLTIWSLARSDLNRARRLSLAALGLATVIGAQYRTGYVCVIVGMAVLFYVRRSIRLPLVAACIVGTIMLINPDPLGNIAAGAGVLASRGQNTELLTSFTGRTLWWDAALTVWGESPLIGKGLLTATRFEVLRPLGFTEVSTIHNGWVEALVGTGAIGVGLLGLAVLNLLRRCLRVMRDNPEPLLVLLMLLIRSITGSSFEIFGYGALLFGWLCLSVPSGPSTPQPKSQTAPE